MGTLLKIPLVTGDNRPYVRLTLTDTNTGVPIDVSAPTTLVKVYFRASGASNILATLACTKPNGGADGVVQFNFPGNTLDVLPGSYEGEVEIDFAGETQTIYDVLKFQLRAEFA
jgi:hypothetical protein